jgi:hypothetical protein
MKRNDKTPIRGRPLNVYIRREDMDRIRKLVGALNARGYRASDSQVIRASLRLARPGDALVKAFLAVSQTDGRRK